jgi:hypothetical protein
LPTNVTRNISQNSSAGELAPRADTVASSIEQTFA